MQLLIGLFWNNLCINVLFNSSWIKFSGVVKKPEIFKFEADRAIVTCFLNRPLKI